MLVGPSGSGKSTLLHIIAHVLPPSTGQVSFHNTKLTKEDVTLVLQTPYFFGDLSLYDNIALVRNFNKTKGRRYIKEIARLFKIEQILKRRANVCSGGEKARANLVRGIYENKDILLIDEPTAHLDYTNSVYVAKTLAAVAKNKLVIVTTHEPEIFNAKNTCRLTLMEGKLYRYD